MRLMDADRLLQEFFNDTPQACGRVGIKCVDDLIKSQPTAYDIEKVIDQLEIKALANALVGNRAAEDTVRECLNIVRGEQE